MSVMGTCVGMVTAVAFVGVGASLVRAARPSSGYLMIAAGLLDLASTCCLGFTASETYYGLMSPQVLRMVSWGSRLAGTLVLLVVGVLLALSIFGLAKAVREAKK